MTFLSIARGRRKCEDKNSKSEEIHLALVQHLPQKRQTTKMVVIYHSYETTFREKYNQNNLLSFSWYLWAPRRCWVRNMRNEKCHRSFFVAHFHTSHSRYLNGFRLWVAAAHNVSNNRQQKQSFAFNVKSHEEPWKIENRPIVQNKNKSASALFLFSHIFFEFLINFTNFQFRLIQTPHKQNYQNSSTKPILHNAEQLQRHAILLPLKFSIVEEFHRSFIFGSVNSFIYRICTQFTDAHRRVNTDDVSTQYSSCVWRRMEENMLYGYFTATFYSTQRY